MLTWGGFRTPSRCNLPPLPAQLSAGPRAACARVLAAGGDAQMRAQRSVLLVSGKVFIYVSLLLSMFLPSELVLYVISRSSETHNS